MTTNASRVVPRSQEQIGSAFSTSSLCNLSESSSPFLAYWYDALSLVASIPRSSPATWLPSSQMCYYDLVPHGSNTTVILQQPDEDEFTPTEYLSEEPLPLIAHRRYQICATFSFKGPATPILLGGSETLAE